MKPKIFRRGIFWICSIGGGLLYSGWGRTPKEAYSKWLEAKPHYLEDVARSKRLRKLMWGIDPFGRPIEGWED